MKKLLILACAAAIGIAVNAATIDLSTVTADTTIDDGTTLTGTLNSNVKLSIADGATVTLSGVTINGVDNSSYNWAGITCIGDATIILQDNNTVRGFYEDYSGIYVPEGKTLTIRGNGALDACSNGFAAGIGAGYGKSCGDIRIMSGTITATGAGNGAGIGGCKYGSCGSIIIEGGTITATGATNSSGIGGGFYEHCGGITIIGGSITATGGNSAPGIGGGRYGSCGIIAIGGNVTRVVAIGTSSYAPLIGAGDGGSEVLVIVDSSLIDTTVGHTRTIKSKVVNLANITENTTVEDGQTIIGTLAANVKVSIAAGATVTLRDATINGVDDYSCQWAGLTCLGNATIILEGSNTVKGFYEYYPGIYVPVGSTLTIKGDGSLDASSNGYGAGIGGGIQIACGNISIEGGTITATGGTSAAGIGGGTSAAGISGGNETDCGDITITGGTITAIGGTCAAGIGGGNNSTCGDITITKDVASVTATKGTEAPNSIGAGDGGTCGTVTIGGVVTGNISESPYTYMSNLDLTSVTADVMLTDGMTLSGTLGGNYKVSIADGATVTLRDATINGVNNSNYDWAGLTCLGNATIILEGSNTVKGFYEDYPGIYVPVGSTLTIKGDGSLDASSNGWGAGIGGGYEYSCGNIRIEGGTITATGGGETTGIGGGFSSTCGDIIITKGVTSVTATKGSDAPCSIGRAHYGTCGTVTIGGAVGEITQSPYTYMPNLDLTSVTTDMILTDGVTLTGTLAANVKVSIADGATVTLRDVTINGVDDVSYDWAGLTCEGDATIILEGSNTVRGFCNNYPGIYVPEGSTLTIKGDGSLDACSTGRGAAIGGGLQMACGNIRIEGGTVTATGGLQSAGIGGGCLADCGDITVTKGVTSVTATKGSYAPCSIGRGYGATCGTVTIGGVVGEITESPYTYVPTRINLAEQTENYTAADGDVLYGETEYAVTVPGGATVIINGVEVAGAGTVIPAPTFSADGKAATTEFVQGAGGKWTLTTFAELDNDALGADVANGQIKVYAASTVEGLESASPMTSGVEVKEKKSAVKTTIVVTPPEGASQFFKVKFGE